MRKKGILTLLYIYCSISVLCAQDTLQSVTLSGLITAISKAQNVKFAYDADLINNIKTPLPVIDNLDSAIQFIESIFPLQFTEVEEHNYAISAALSRYVITAIDSSSMEPLPLESLMLAISGKALPTEVTSQSVSFVLFPQASDTVVAYSFGYKQQIIPFSTLISSKKLTILLSSPTIRLSELVIEDYLTKGINMNPADQSITIKTADLPLLPGETDGDVFASLAALPGLTSPDNRAGNLMIRGSDTDQSLVLYDNIPIYHRGHYYGMISPYNPKMIRQVKVYRSGFHPRMGGRVGGAILINSDQKVVTPSFGLGANTYFATAYAKVPINKISISIGARHSYPGQFQSKKLEEIAKAAFSGSGQVDQNGNVTGDIDVLFEDYNGQVNFQANSNNNFSLSAIYTNTEINLFAPTVITTGQIPEVNNFSNIGTKLEWRWTMPNQWVNTISATYSKYNYEYTTIIDQVNPENNYFSINELKDLNIREELSGQLSQKIKLQVGIDFKDQSASLNYRNASMILNQDIVLKVVQNSFTLSPYINSQWNISKRFFAEIGMRVSYYDELSEINISPRATINYEANPWMTWKGSLGYYQQYLSHVKHLEFGFGGLDSELWTLADNKYGNVMKGSQSMIGTIIHHNQWILDIEGYFKTANDISIYEGQRLSDSQDLSTYDQKLFGVDFFVKYQASDFISLWMNYSFSGSEILIDTARDVSYESKYVQPHVFGVGGSLIKNNWKLSGQYKASSGLNAQSLDIVYVENIFNNHAGSRPPNAPNPFDGRPERYPVVHTLDISCSYQIPKTETRKWKASFGLSLLNLLNQKNLVDQVFRNTRPPGFKNRYSIGFAPNLMVMLEF